MANSRCSYKRIPLALSIFKDFCSLLLLQGIGLPPISAENGGGAMLMMGQAERLIQSLQLVPSLPSPHGASPGGFDGYANVGPSLFERKLDLSVLGGSGSFVSNEELGHHAGYFQLKDTYASRMFYMFFESRGNKADDPVILWMSGGPGCSSELALFYENGPFHITENLTLEWNEHGWDSSSSIIFVDQPIGTGFSYSSDDRDFRHDEAGVSDDMYHFLQAFFQAHPEFSNNSFFVTGESYAGHYVPAVTSRVHKGNKAREGLFPINLKGFAIGNGLTDPEIQYQAYADYALEMGLIEENEHERLSQMFPACHQAIQQCGDNGTTTCDNAYVVCNAIFNRILSVIKEGINYYDIRTQCNGSLCYNFSSMESYLNQEVVKEALGVGNIKFVSCSPTVYKNMIMDWMRNLEVGIPALLEDGIRLLVYAGEYDLICNWLGNSRWVSAIDWSGKEMYNDAHPKKFVVGDDEAGIFSSYGPLTFLKVHDAGHMVPMDQPRASLEMITRFTRGIPLDFDLPVMQAVTDSSELVMPAYTWNQ